MKKLVKENLSFERTDTNIYKNLKIGKFRFDKNYFSDITEKMNDVIEKYGDQNLWDSVILNAELINDVDLKIKIETPFRYYSVGKELKDILKILGIPIKGKMQTTTNNNSIFYTFNLNIEL